MKKLDNSEGTMSLICNLSEFLDCLKPRMLKNYGQTLRMIQSLNIKCLSCLFVCMFGNFLATILFAAHTANNLDLGNKQCFENEGYENN